MLIVNLTRLLWLDPRRNESRRKERKDCNEEAKEHKLLIHFKS